MGRMNESIITVMVVQQTIYYVNLVIIHETVNAVCVILSLDSFWIGLFLNIQDRGFAPGYPVCNF